MSTAIPFVCDVSPPSAFDPNQFKNPAIPTRDALLDKDLDGHNHKI
jgi:hypothetical protein